MLTKSLLLLPLGVALALAGDDTDRSRPDDAWKDKPIPEWTERDAKDVLASSPWSRTVTPAVARQQQNNGIGQQRPGGYGRGGGIGIGGIGFPGGGRRSGGGYPGGGYPGGNYPNNYPDGNYPNDTRSGNGQSREPDTLTVRWESALPIREAELKARETSAPTVDDGHYAIAVYGMPRNSVTDDKRALDDMKKKSAIKRDNKKDIAPTSVEVHQHENGPVVVFFFPRTKEITSGDRRVLLDITVGRYQFSESFYLEDMTFQGKLEL